MSVVNKMLQDLEQRRDQDILPDSDYQPPVKRSALLPRTALLVLLLVVLVAVMWMNRDTLAFLLSDKPQTQAPMVKVRDAASSVEPVAVSQAGAESEAAQPEQDNVADPQTTSTPAQTEQATVAASQVRPIMPAPDTAPPVPAPQTASTPQAEQVADPALSVVKSRVQVPVTEQLREQAQQALQQGDEPRAIEALQDLLELQPENQGARKKLAALLFAQQRELQAASVLNEGLELDQDNTDMRLMLAKLHHRLGQVSTALEILSVYNPQADLAPEYVGLRAALLQQQGDYTEASQDYRALIQSDSGNYRWWLGYAVCQDKLGNAELASQAYRQVDNNDEADGEVRQFARQRVAALAGVN